MISINWIAILVNAFIALALGAFWYSPILFGTRWMTLMGKSEKDLGDMRKGVWKSYLLTFVSSIVTAFILDLFIQYRLADSFGEGAIIGVLAWIGFVVPTALGNILFENRPKGLFYINMAYYLVLLAIMGGVLAFW